jgi:hypothetical protein
MTLSSSPTLSSQLPVSSPQRSPLSLQRSILGTILYTLRCESIRRPSARQTPKSKYPTLPTLHHVSPRAYPLRTGAHVRMRGGGVRSRSVGRRAVSPKVWYPLLSLQSKPIQRTLIPYLDSLSSHSCNTTNPSKALLNEETTAVAKDHHVCHSSVPARITRRRASQAPQCCVMTLVEPAQLGKSC